MAEFLDLFLVADTKALFFVDDQQPEVLELDALAQQPMRADNQVDLTIFETIGDRFGLLGGEEPAQHLGESGRAPSVR